MKIKMNEKIQGVIIAVQSYFKWIIAESQLTGKWSPVKDYEKDAYTYYFNLLERIPHNISYQKEMLKSPIVYDFGLSTSKACFNAILRYPIEKTLKTEINELGKFEFSYEGE